MCKLIRKQACSLPSRGRRFKPYKPHLRAQKLLPQPCPLTNIIPKPVAPSWSLKPFSDPLGSMPCSPQKAILVNNKFILVGLCVCHHQFNIWSKFWVGSLFHLHGVTTTSGHTWLFWSHSLISHTSFNSLQFTGIFAPHMLH